MTLFEIVPSLRHAVTPRIDRAIWPLTTRADELGRLCVGEVALTDVADEFGSPVYVIDEADFRHRIRRFRAALQDARLVYAGRALLTTVVARWAAEEEVLACAPVGNCDCAHRGRGTEPNRRAWHGREPRRVMRGRQH